MKKITAPEETAKSTGVYSNTKPARPPFKMEETIKTFIECGDLGMNQLEANKRYGETCLHTSISTLDNSYGIRFKRQPENIKNRAGTLSRFTRYSFLTESDERRAKNLVNSFRKRRGLLSMTWEVAAPSG